VQKKSEKEGRGEHRRTKGEKGKNPTGDWKGSDQCRGKTLTARLLGFGARERESTD